ncbi:hypothetical protein PR048_004680 [Dryococelus australis]|uniref:Uncharacterized protein n=1 Tax=Dryococelus australis TaxID=614101 RepID=A0ABQ9I644_9NEOP|nr:hypothetical protein PR048_004680 [Dryococelus australis]
MVNKFQGPIVGIVKENFPRIGKYNTLVMDVLHNYKNKHNFISLCLQEEDFQIKAQWSVFATSSGKSECDEIVPTIDQFLRLCETNIKNVNFRFVDKETLDSKCLALEKRFINVDFIPGTRNFYNFKPLIWMALLKLKQSVSTRIHLSYTT